MAVWCRSTQGVRWEYSRAHQGTVGSPAHIGVGYAGSAEPTALDAHIPGCSTDPGGTHSLGLVTGHGTGSPVTLGATPSCTLGPRLWCQWDLHSIPRLPRFPYFFQTGSGTQIGSLLLLCATPGTWIAYAGR
jgi:hypothetical protein